jgi:putative transposase
MARRKPPIIPDELLDQLLAGRDPLGKDGLVDELKRALNAEMDHHLDGEAAEGRANSRNGYGRKTLITDSGKLPISVPRDRLSTFDPQLIAKYRRRLPGFDDKVVSMYARGMTVREIQAHLAEIYGIDVSPDLISAVTDAILEEIAEWQNRPLEAVYPLVFFDGSRCATRARSATKPSISPSASGPTAARRSSAFGSSRPKVPSSGCG